MKDATRIDRRRMLALTAAGTVATLSGGARAALTTEGERRLAFYNLHTGEALTATYWLDGGYVAEEMRRIDRMLRDFRTGEAIGMDPKLMDLLYGVRRHLGANEPFHVVSGYRSLRTNAALRKASEGVAVHSLHTVGRAIDIRIPGKRLGDVRRAALALGKGGVGYYPKSDFVHLDTGRVRIW